MTKNVSITVDITIARRMLKVAGFSLQEIDESTDDEIFEKVLAMIDCFGATFKVKGGLNADLSYIMLFEVVRELGPYKTDEVVLFNVNHISEEEALRHVKAGEYNPNVLVMPKKQWISMFRDGKEG